MSALRRSRSKTAPDTTADTTEAHGPIPTSNNGLSDPSFTNPFAPPPARASVEGMDLEPDAVRLAELLSSIPSSNAQGPEAQMEDSTGAAQDGMDDHGTRSSSLSELGDASDLHSEQPTPRMTETADMADNDSEAETERLDATPQKPVRTGTAASEQLYERTPSKLVNATGIDEDESVPASPTAALGGPAPPSANAALDTLSFLAAEEAVSLEMAGKKRKRSSADTASVDEPVGEPVRKRSSNVRDSVINGHRGDKVDEAETMDVEEELDNAEERISELAQEGAELEERQATVAAETVNELATVAKLAKPRKGGRRGKRKMEMTAQLMSAETADAEGEADNDEDENSSYDEESANKKKAIDGLAMIEKKFKIFREKLCDEEISRYEQELEMLKQPNCTHPEYLAMMACIDERRANKIEHEKQLMKHKLQCHERQTIAWRHQLHSQYFQAVRDLREKALAECNHQIHQLQQGRRKFGHEEVEYAMRLPEKRSERVRQQAAYNLEVSVLSGVAKYVGFPAAPDIKSARPSEIDDDFRAMKIATRPPPQPIAPYIRPPLYTRNSTADEVAAEEQFIEKTPWANPQHPAHQHPHYAVMGASRAPVQTYQTPAGQRRMVDIHAPNGSASTIDALSNPPSSATATGMQSNGRVGESISPVFQMKRNPSDHLQYADTPASLPRNFAGMGRESYANAHILSSPAVDARQEEHHGPRWTPMNGGAPPLPPNVGRQMPLTQRSSLGTVSVGTGAALFGR